MIASLLLLQVAALPPGTPPARYRVELALYEGERQVAAPVVDLAEGGGERVVATSPGYTLHLRLARVAGERVRIDAVIERPPTARGRPAAVRPVFLLREAGFADLTAPRTRFRVSATATRLAGTADATS